MSIKFESLEDFPLAEIAPIAFAIRTAFNVKQTPLKLYSSPHQVMLTVGTKPRPVIEGRNVVIQRNMTGQNLDLRGIVSGNVELTLPVQVVFRWNPGAATVRTTVGS
jgi:hypothetical protein